MNGQKSLAAAVVSGTLPATTLRPVHDKKKMEVAKKFKALFFEVTIERRNY